MIILIKLTRLNDSVYYLNCDEIYMIESRPDTTVTVKTGDKYVVKESTQEVYDRIIEYRGEAYLYALSRVMQKKILK